MLIKHMTPQDQLKQLMASLQKNADANARARQESDRNTSLTQIGRYFSAALQPLRDAVEEMKRIGGSLGILTSRLNSLEIPKPEVTVDLSSLRIPEPNITVKPIVDITSIKFPKEMDIKGWVNIMGYDRGLLTNPIPVQLRDATGKPIDLSAGLGQMIGISGGGGGGNHVIVDNLDTISITSAEASSVSLVNADGNYYNSDNPLPITGSITTTPGATFYASDAIGSVNIVQVGGSAVVVGTGYQDNALRVVHATDAVASVNIVSNIAALDVKQVSGSMDSVNLMQTLGNPTVVGTGYQDNALRVVNATDAITSVNIVSSVALTATVSGSLSSSVAVGPVVADAVDDGNAPVQMGGIARTANPTAVAGGDVVKMSMDDLGRQITRPVQVRDLIATAYATLTNGTETTLASAVSGNYLDLIYVLGANNSSVAVQVDIRPVTAGNVVMTLMIPANGTAGVALPVPLPQSDPNNNWTADMGDITGTTVYLSALFSKEI